MAKFFQPSDFVDALTKGDIQEGLSLIGMAKVAEGDAKALMFSPKGSCENWIRIPLDSIEKVEHVGTVRCKDHEHPVVRLFFKDPGGTASIFISLLRALVIQGEESRPPASSPAPRAAGPWFSWCMSQGPCPPGSRQMGKYASMDCPGYPEHNAYWCQYYS